MDLRVVCGGADSIEESKDELSTQKEELIAQNLALDVELSELRK